MKLSVIPNKDGRLEVFTLDEVTTGRVKHRWQKSANGAWNDGWADMGVINTGRDLATSRNADGRVEVFVTAANGDVWHRWQQTPGGAFSGWANMGGH
jgi:hypothetical protein